MAVSLSVANDHASLPIAWRLYLPETWVGDPERRARAGVPEEVGFETKPEIALRQIRQAQVEGRAARGGAGRCRLWRRDRLPGGHRRGMDLTYVLGVQSSASLWPPGEAPLPVPPLERARAATHPGSAPPPGHQPVSAKKLAEGLPARAWRTITWRQGSRTALASRFVALRVRPAHRDQTRREPWPEEWLLIEWELEGARRSPPSTWLSNLPPRTALRELVHTAKARWLIERDYQELKQEIGLGHYEGRGWRGFHHHASLCIAAYGFLVAERCLFPPRRRFARRRLAAPCATRRLPAARRPRSGLNGTSRTRSVGLVGSLPRCPCCLQPPSHNIHMT